MVKSDIVPTKSKKKTARKPKEPTLEESNYDDLYAKLTELEEKIEKLSK